MRKFNRILKRLLKQIKRLIATDDYLKLLKYIIFLLKKNKEIEENKLAGGINNLKLEKFPAKRGEIFLVDFGYNIGTEFRYMHYCVVLKVNRYMATVLPLTSKNKNNLTTINLGVINKLGSNINSYGLLNQIRSISRARLIRPTINGNRAFIKLSANQLNIIDNELKIFFNLT